MSNKIEHTPSTRKNIRSARLSFERTIGKKAEDATKADIEKWMHALRSLGRATGTCRTYLSFVKQIAGLGVTLPKREPTQSRSLSDAELKSMLGIVKPDFYALLASLLICSTSVLDWTWGDLTDLVLDIPVAAKMILINEASRRGKDTLPLLSYGRPAHWVNESQRDEIIFPISVHRINRHLKSIAKKAGIGEKNMNLTAIKSACRRLWFEYRTADRIAQMLTLRVSASPLMAFPAKRSDPRLHGIGRRSLLIETV